MQDRTESDWVGVLLRCGVKPTLATAWAPHFAAVLGQGALSGGDAELDDFLGQVLHESAGLTRLTENLSYSAERLCQVWPKRFATLAAAQPYAHNPQALANRVYANRLGNGDEASGDGWRYRGRAPIQITGRDNYAAVGRLLGLDLVAYPDLLETPRTALAATVAWWEGSVPDALLGDPEAVTRRVNGGLTGLAERVALTERAHEALA